jgi:hypothetical protein
MKYTETEMTRMLWMKDTFVLIAEVDPTIAGFTYFDDGRHNGVSLKKDIEYCYYVITKGAYNVDEIEYPLENKSQVICARPDDDRLPCPPVLVFEGPECTEYLSDKGCGNNTFEHELSWEPDFSGVCDDELSEFRLYFTPEGEETQFNLWEHILHLREMPLSRIFQIIGVVITSPR